MSAQHAAPVPLHVTITPPKNLASSAGPRLVCQPAPRAIGPNERVDDPEQRELALQIPRYNRRQLVHIELLLRRERPCRRRSRARACFVELATGTRPDSEALEAFACSCRVLCIRQPPFFTPVASAVVNIAVPDVSGGADAKSKTCRQQPSAVPPLICPSKRSRFDLPICGRHRDRSAGCIPRNHRAKENCGMSSPSREA